nr:hypothetical protein [Tanacetum cinerariifolium]
GTQESEEKQRDVLPKIHKGHHSSLHDEETFNPKTKQAPKPKASARRKRSDSDTSITPPIAIPTRITTVAAVLRLTAAVKWKTTSQSKKSI